MAAYTRTGHHGEGGFRASGATRRASPLRCGEGPLASIAIGRALACDSRYSMALLLREILDAGVPPSAARLPMSPGEAEQSYVRGPGNKRPETPRLTFWAVRPAGAGLADPARSVHSHWETGCRNRRRVA